MKVKALILSGLALFSFSVSAVEVLGAKLDASGENILVKVSHGGGCGDHKYELVMKGCAESMPVQCRATIKHTTNDFCEALITREAKFNLKSYGLTKDYYQDAMITISGDDNTSAVVRLTKTTAPSTFLGGKVRCLTHTGSILEIANQTVTLTTTENEVREYSVIGTNIRVLESFPPIYQTILKLDDGRKIETNFRGESKEGTGEFIRLDGTRSPEFKCVSK